VVEEIEKGCSNASRLLTVHLSLVSETLLKFGTESQIERWLPGMTQGRVIGAFALTEPEVGTNAGGVRTGYEVRDGLYILNGRKKWISFGGIADFFLVIARRRDELSAFIVESWRPGVEVVPMRGLLGCRGSYVSEILFNDELEEEFLLGRRGQGFTYIASYALDHGRYSVAWSGVGLAQASLNAMASYARQRRQFDRVIGSFQLVQKMIADAVTETEAARSLCTRASELRQTRSPEAVIETIMSKYFASKTAFHVASNAVQVHGGNGCSSEYPVERYLREAKILEIIEGTSQIQQVLIAKHGLRRFGRKD